MIKSWTPLALATALLVPVVSTPLLAQAAAVPVLAQTSAAAPLRLEFTTASAEARSEFQAAMDDILNLYPVRGYARLKHAVELDPGFGLARVINGIGQPGLTPAQRDEEIARGMSDATKASTGELLLATAYRENRRRNVVEARAILLTAGTQLPGEPWIPYLRAMWVAGLAGSGQTDIVVPLRQVVERFPEYAPAYNNLGYAQWRSGDEAQALATAASYVAKAPNHPNSHDSYAELLQWGGRYDEAIAHYTKATELSPAFLSASQGLSEAYTLTGKGDLSRQTLNASLANTTTPVERLNVLNRIVNSYVMEGNLKAATTAMGAVIAEARKSALPNAERGAHATLMNLEAAFGSSKAVAGHLVALDAVTPAATPGSLNGRYASVGTSFAIAGQAAPARMYLDSLTRSAAAAPSENATALVHQLSGWVLYSEAKYADALAHFRQGNQAAPVVRTGTALSLVKLGNLAEARWIRDDMVNSRVLNLANTGDVMARRMLKQRVM